MGAELLSTSAAFSASITACAKALKPFGVDLLGAFSEDDGFSSPIMGAVGLVAIQVRHTFQLAQVPMPAVCPQVHRFLTVHLTALSKENAICTCAACAPMSWVWLISSI